MLFAASGARKRAISERLRLLLPDLTGDDIWGIEDAPSLALTSVGALAGRFISEDWN
jgi:hypothetical protein